VRVYAFAKYKTTAEYTDVTIMRKFGAKMKNQPRAKDIYPPA